MLYRICAGLLLLAAVGHTLGGMLGTARRGPKAGPEADDVVRFLSRQWTVRERVYGHDDRRALGTWWRGPDAEVGAAPTCVGRVRRPRAHVPARIQVLRSA